MPDHFISSEQAELRLLATAAFIAERIRSSDGHAEAMSAVVPGYLAIGDVDLAAELANAVDEPFSRDKLLTLVAEKCAENDDDEYALQLAESIEDQGLSSRAMERIGLIKAGKGQVAQASAIADTMAHPDLVLAAIAVHHARSGDMAASAKALDEIAFSSARVSALLQMAAISIEAGEKERALASLEKAFEATADIEHDEERIRHLCDVGTLFIDASRNDKAIEAFAAARAAAEALDNVHRDFFLVNCALGFLAAGSTDLADHSLDLVADKTQMASALLGFARDHWKKEEKEEAVEALEEAYEILRSQRERETRDSRARNNLMSSIAVQFAGFGRSERGTEIAFENQDPGERTEALSQIAQILTLQKRDDLARQTVEMIDEDADRLFALIAISDVKSKLDERDAALKLLHEAADLVETIPQYVSRSTALNEIASRSGSLGASDDARALALTNLAVIAEIRDESAQAAALVGLDKMFKDLDLEPGDDERKYLRQLVQKTVW